MLLTGIADGRLWSWRTHGSDRHRSSLCTCLDACVHVVFPHPPRHTVITGYRTGCRLSSIPLDGRPHSRAPSVTTNDDVVDGKCRCEWLAVRILAAVCPLLAAVA